MSALAERQVEDLPLLSVQQPTLLEEWNCMRVVAGCARDADDLRFLLSALGIL